MNNSFWDKIKETDTFKSMQNDVDSLKDNFQVAKDKKEEYEATKVVKSKPVDKRQTESIERVNVDDVTIEEKITVPPSEQKNTNQRSKGRKAEPPEDPKERTLMILDKIFNFMKGAAVVIAIAGILITAFGGGAAYGTFVSLLDPETLNAKDNIVEAVSDNTESSEMLWASGETLSTVRSDLRRTEIPIEDMSNYALQGVIATEDSYFFEHNGIVIKSILRAAIEQVTNTGTSGGSTLTQQLIKQQLLTSETSFERKANEIVLAMELEEVMSKDDILENYMNTSPFGRNNRGENIAGIEEAAQGIFGVTSADLTLAQAAFVAGLPQNPIIYSPYNNDGSLKEDPSEGIERQQNVLYFMYREGYIDEAQYDSSVNYDITQDFLPPAPAETTTRSYAYDAVEREARDILQNIFMAEDGVTQEQLDSDTTLAEEYYNLADNALRYGGYTVTSTLNKDVHNTLQQVATDNQAFMGTPRDVYWVNEETGEENHLVDYVQNGSILLDNASGAIIGFVGGVNYDLNNVNHALYTRRNPGSTFKPFSVYGPAFEYGLITPASMVYDTEVSFDVIENGQWTEYTPTNATRYTNEWWDVRSALAGSQNIPAMRIFNTMYENYDVLKYARAAGLGPDAIADTDVQNLSYALGGITYGTTVLEMAAAYASIANDGQFVEPFLIASITDSQGESIYQNESATSTVFGADTAFLLQDILRDALETGGTATYTTRNLNVDADIFAKTGTSNDERDVWVIGSTPKVTLASWMGYSNIMEINELASENGYYPNARLQVLWARLFNAVAGYDGVLGLDQTFDVPSGITRDTVVANTGMKANDNVAGPDGEVFATTGDTKEEYFASDNIPGQTIYEFGIDATDEELSEFWNGKEKEAENPIEELLDDLFGNDEDESEEENDSEESSTEEETTSQADDNSSSEETTSETE